MVRARAGKPGSFQKHDGLTRLLRNNTWAVIVVATIATIGLGVLADWQAASLLACVLGCLVMCNSEIDNPRAPELALKE